MGEPGDETPAGDGNPDPAWQQLHDEAAAIDGAGNAQAGQPAAGDAAAAPATPTNSEAIGFLVIGFRELSCAMLEVESPRRTLADPIAQQLGQVLGEVCDRHGWDIAGAFGRHGADLAAAMIAGPLLLTAYRELDMELRAKRAKNIPGADGRPDNGQSKPDTAGGSTGGPGPAPQPGAASAVNVGVQTRPAFRE